MRILLCVSDAPHTARALDLGTRIATSAATAVDILAVAQHGREELALQAAEAAARELRTAGVDTTVITRTGQTAQEVTRQARAAPYELVVIGSRGRRGMVRLLLGSVALRVTGHTPTSVLVVKGRARELNHFLVCSAAGPTSEHTVRFASHLARALTASVTLLHVMSQLPLMEDATTEDLSASAEELIQRRSREGVHLSQMLDLLRAERTPARAVVRHGLVRDEIISEAREGRYDLLVIGAHVTPGLPEALAEDLSADILLAADRPVLIVR